jgi:serine/threonine protein kinase/Tfp pilus assembly protein PilF
MTASVHGSAAVAPPDSASGLDDPRVVRAAKEYLARAEAGGKPSLAEFVARHPDIAEPLRRCLAGLEFVQEAAPHLSQPLDGVASPDGGGAVTGTLGDFRIIREVGRGGMGVVYEAEQISLGRRVALKVLPFAATMDPRHLQRFRNEARAAASLEHPHIVPVYGVGCERGVHYYAMKFIDGQSLASLLQQHRADPASGASQPPNGPASDDAPGSPEAWTTPTAAGRTQRAPRDAAAFRQVAAWGIQAAEALEHAHGIGVVHRDIKPANLLIDGQGALWVTDYGLARTAADAGPTMTGDVLGTLRYMSPEQALAKHGLVDHRTDIYSLGVTLYELLTGTPAVGGKDREEILNAITLQERRPPRALDAAIPRDLETIVLKAMEERPADRYGTAQEMAADLERFLKDEPIRAWRSPLRLRLRKWGRRHRPLVASLAAGLLTLLLVGLVLAFGYQRRLVQTERAVTAALAQVDTLVGEGDKLLGQPERWQATARLAQAALEKAEGLLAAGAATAPLTRRVEEARATVEAALADSGLLIELHRIRLEQAIARRGRFCVADSASSYAKILGAYRVGLEAPASAAERIRSSRLRESLLAALEDWWRACDEEGARRRLEQVLRAADPTNVARARWREAAGRRDGAALVKMAAELEAQRLPPAVVCCRAADLTSLNQWAAAERLLKAALARDPGDFWLNHDLGMVIQEQGPARAEEAVGYLRAALVLRSDSPLVHLHMGLALEDKGDLDGAIACCRAALAIDSGDHHALNNLGILLMSRGRVDEAVSSFQRAIAVDPENANAHNNLGNALWACERRDQAIRSFRRAIAIDPQHYDALVNLGCRLQSIGRLEEASECLKRAVAAKPNKTDPRFAIAPYNLGMILGDQGRLDEAIDAYREAIRLKKDYAEAHCNLGLVLLKQGKFQTAAAELRRGHELGSQRPGWRYPSEVWVRHAESLADLDARLPALLKDQEQPRDARERLALAQFCQHHKHLFAAATGWYRDAFAEEPKLADDLRGQNRYHAARAAALAGSGQGEDVAQLPDQERARLRKQGLTWLRADLAAYASILAKGPAPARAEVQQRLRHWQQASDFTGVRGAALARLPAAERRAWKQLWEEVADLLPRIEAQAAPEKKADGK